MAGLRWQRVAYIRPLTLISSLLAVVAVAGGAQAAGFTLRAIDYVTGGEVPYASVRIGEVRREVLAPSGRIQLNLGPAQVGAGGRVFVFGRVPPEMGLQEFDAEILVWHGIKSTSEGKPDVPPRWRRYAMVHKNPGQLGHVSATLVIDALESGPVPVAVFRRETVSAQTERLVTQQFRVPRAAQLHFAYSLDEWDWHGLAPVTLSVVAQEVRDGGAIGDEIELFRKHLVPADSKPQWFDQRLDLSDLAGMTVHLEFRALAQRAAGKVESAHAVWSVPGVVYGRRAGDVPSIVVITIDGVRARSLGCCGAERAVTPFIDELFGTQGAIFDRAVTQAVTMLPAQMTLLTGLYPSVHGVLNSDVALGEGAVSVAEVIAGRGYSTAAFIDSVPLAAETGAGRGFGLYRQAKPRDVWDTEGSSAATLSSALEWIGDNTATPVFVFIDISQALPPYVPPRGYLDYFKDSLAQPSPEPGIDEGARIRYEREIRYLDDQLRSFVEGLDKVSPPDATLLIVTSPHGQEFLEHGARASGAQLYEESIRVPLLMRGAGIRPGSRYSEVIGLVDLAPTILDFANAEIPDQMQGRSIAKSLRSGLPYSLPPRFSEAHASRKALREGEDKSWRPPAYAVSQGGHKVIMNSSSDASVVFEAYDLVDDPNEELNLVGADKTPPAWFQELREVLEGYPVACKRVAKPQGPAPSLSPEIRLGLRAVMY